MKVHTLADLRYMRADETFRTPPWGPLVTSLVFLAISLLSAWFLVKHHAPGGFFWEAIFWAGWALVALSVPIAFFGSFVPTLNPATNWVLKVKADRLYLMLRDYRGEHPFDDGPVAVSFATREIESVGQQEKRIAVPESDGGTLSWKERRLEIRLRDKLPEEFIAALQAQPQWSNTRSLFKGRLKVRSKNAPIPLSVDERSIRILWSGRAVGIAPRIDRAIAILGRTVPVHDKTVVERSRWAELPDLELDDNILELCQAGNTMDAIMLLRRRRNYSLTAAKQFVDELSGSRSPRSVTAGLTRSPRPSEERRS